jgi:hypothetical protein
MYNILFLNGGAFATWILRWHCWQLWQQQQLAWALQTELPCCLLLKMFA